MHLRLRGVHTTACRAGVWHFAGQWGSHASQGRVRPLPITAGGLAVASQSHALVVEGPEAMHLSGQNGHGQLGRPEGPTDTLWAHTLAHLHVQLAGAGLGFTWIVTPQALSACGTNTRGQIGLGAKVQQAGIFTQVPLPAPVCRIEGIAAGLDHTLILAHVDQAPHAAGTQQVWSCGLNTDGQLGRPAYMRYADHLGAVEVDIPAQERIVQVAAGGDTSAILTDMGRVWVWGNNEYGQGVASSSADQLRSPTQADVPPFIQEIQVGGSFMLAMDASGTLYTTGYGATGHPYQGWHPLPMPNQRRVQRIAASTSYAAAITDDGSLYVWGLDSFHGRLGLGLRADRRVYTPTKVPLSGAADNVVCGGETMLVRMVS